MPEWMKKVYVLALYGVRTDDIVVYVDQCSNPCLYIEDRRISARPYGFIEYPLKNYLDFKK